MKAHVPVYRPILKHALETAWIHRELWPIAAVAGLAGTGAVVNDVLNHAKLAASFPSSRFSETFGNLHLFETYRDQIIVATTGQITLITLTLILMVILAAFVVAACQQVILRVAHLALKRKTHLSFAQIRQEFMHPRVFRFLSLDLLLKLMIVNLMIVGTWLISGLNIGQIVTDAVFGLIFSATILSLALTLNVLVVMALIGVARKDLGLAESLTYAWRAYRRHSVIFLEMSLLLFAVNFLISSAYDGTILVLGVTATLGFMAALASGSFPVYLCLVALTGLIAVVITLAFAGFATTFTYSAWAALAERLEKTTITPRVVVHGQRMFEHLK